MRRRQTDWQTHDARLVRQAMSPAERRLWAAFRGHRFLGLGIRRGAPIGPDVADFLIPAHRLVLTVVPSRMTCPPDPAAEARFRDAGYRVWHLPEVEALTDLPGLLARLTESLADV